jgi:uncharacterized protein YegL
VSGDRGIDGDGRPVTDGEAVSSPRPDNVTIYWLIDESGSMRMDGNATTLQTALALGCEELARPRPGYPLLDIHSRTLYFGSTPRWHTAARTPMRDVRVGELLPHGPTNLAPALRELTREIGAESVAGGALPPVVVLVSDGLPTDSYSDALAEFDSVCTRTCAIRLAVSIGRLGALELCREFMGASPFDCLAATSPSALSRTIHELCAGVVPAFLTRACGGRCAIPLEPALRMPRLLVGAVRAKRLTVQSFHVFGSRQVSDGLAGAVLADLSAGSPGDEVDLRKIEPALSDLLERTAERVHPSDSPSQGLAAGEAIADARAVLLRQGLRGAAFSFVYSDDNRISVRAGRPLAIAAASNDGTTVESIGTAAGAADGPGELAAYAFDVLRPSVVLIGSKSLRDAFGSDEDFGAVAGDLFRIATGADPAPRMEASFHSWLKKASAAGSDSVAAIVLQFPDQPLR